MSRADSELISLRATKEFKDRLKAWSEDEGGTMTGLLEAMAAAYARERDGQQVSPVEALLRTHFRAIEREMGNAFEDLEGKVRFYQSEGETYRERAERREQLLKEQAEGFEQERQGWSVAKAALETKLQESQAALHAEQEAREQAESLLKEQRETSRFLAESLNEARLQLAEAQQLKEANAALTKERDALNLQNQQLALEKGALDLSLAVVREELQKEREASQRAGEAYRREFTILEKEYAARFTQVQLEAEKARLEAREEALSLKEQSLQEQAELSEKAKEPPHPLQRHKPDKK